MTGPLMTGPSAGLAAVVTEYDFEVGLGVVSSAEGASYRFHCTAIADGSRSIAVGTEVLATIGPAGPGLWEALRVVPIS